MLVTRYHRSAGGVLYDPKTRRVAMVHFPDDGLYALPKGHLHHGERPRDAATREVREETGYTNIKCVAKLGSVQFTYRHWLRKNEWHHKQVDHYLFMLKGSEHNSTLRDEDETHVIVWLPIDAAIKKIRYENSRKLMVKAKRILSQ